MRSVSDWLAEYGTSHQHPTNKLLHWICVPPIVLAVMGFLWSLPVPTALASLSPWANWAMLVSLAALLYYWMLSARLAAGLVLVFAALLWCTRALGSLPWPLWSTSLVIFVIAWIGQFIGMRSRASVPHSLRICSSC